MDLKIIDSTIKQRTRERIERQVADYLARGGEIKQCTADDNAGADAHIQLNKRDRIRRDKRRGLVRQADWTKS